MSSLSYQAEPQIQFLYQLIRGIADGTIGLPRFQRPFVWTKEQCLELYRSIRAGTPIGSVMLWRTNREDIQCYDNLGPYELQKPSASVRTYIIDGHQRLATLFAALHVPAPGAPLPEEIAYYDLEEEDFLFAPRREAPKLVWLPLRFILDFPELLPFQRGLMTQKEADKLVRRCDPVVTAFGQYKIPVITIVTNSLDDITKTFQRINSQGTVMSEVHMISALTWRDDFDLNERVSFWKEQWLSARGWGDLDDEAILYVCKAVLGFGIYDPDVDAISTALRHDHEAIEKAGSALVNAVDFLGDHCGIRGPGVLPYPSHIVPLAVAMDRKLKSAKGLDIEAFVRWFWLMAYSGTSAGLAKVLQTLEYIAGESSEPPPLAVHLGARLPPLPKRFDFRTARCRALALRLADLVGDPGYRMLADHGAKAMPHLLLDWRSAEKEPFAGPANRILVRPEDAPAARKDIERACAEGDRSVLDRHVISADAAVCFAGKDYGQFIELRRQALEDLENDFARTKGLLQP